MIELLGKLFILIALIFMGIGVFGYFRFQDFYHRILISSKVEILGFITIMFGIMLHSGFTFFSGKVLLILVTVVITNPLASHAIVRSAYFSGHPLSSSTTVTKEEGKDD